MPRQLRLYVPGMPIHVTQRGVNRCAIFLGDIDRQHYYHLLLNIAAEHCIEVHAYVFMDNHVHLLLTSPDYDALPRAMRKLGQRYVQAFNQRYQRCGPLWQGRFKSCTIDSERYLMTVYRYIELNPVRAAMVERPEQHRWSSVHANLGLIEDRLVTPHPLFVALGKNRAVRADAYREWLRQGTPQGDLDDIRTHLQQERALGSETFQVMLETTLGRPTRARQRGRPPC